MILSVLISLFTLSLPSPVLAKSYALAPVNLDFTLNANGSMDVVETRDYNFSGDYTFAYQTIGKSGGEITQTGRNDSYVIDHIRVCESLTPPSCYRLLSPTEVAGADNTRPENTYYIRDDGDSWYVKWFYRAGDETKSFILAYTVNNALTRQTDVDELYWTIIGDQWEIGQSAITANFHLLPGLDGAQLRAWAHGPLSGRVAIDSPELITYTLPSLSPGEFFEARFLLPQGIFQGGATGTFSRTQIIAQENEFIQETINRQTQSRSVALLIIFGGILIIGLCLFLFIKSLLTLRSR